MKRFFFIAVLFGENCRYYERIMYRLYLANGPQGLVGTYSQFYAASLQPNIMAHFSIEGPTFSVSCYSLADGVGGG